MGIESFGRTLDLCQSFTFIVHNKETNQEGNYEGNINYSFDEQEYTVELAKTHLTKKTPFYVDGNRFTKPNDAFKSLLLKLSKFEIKTITTTDNPNHDEEFPLSIDQMTQVVNCLKKTDTKIKYQKP